MEGQLSLNNTSVSSRFLGMEDNRPDVGETESPRTSSTVEEINPDRPDAQETEYGNARTSEKMQMHDDDEPKLGMKFNSLEDLMSYYKEYDKKCSFSPKKSLFFRCNREVSESVKRVLDTNDLSGIRMNKNFGSLVVNTSDSKNLLFLEDDCRNYIDNARHLRLGAGSARVLRDYFLRMQYKNPGFFALMDLDDDERLKNVFWANPHNRAAYQYFGDVITFDITYLTNRYEMPFAPFVGVNHHRQSILLEAGLISFDDTETFV
ncbi:hypothetical protein F2P56_002484 [Juglans regia]|uniref:MULE transposase domain-containing protein n=2 Tax=Juglans regia TaxID=51240 RepID=A0A833Y927_JUGRE|nr:protein FAR1-RELATED SEQUENCE 5-like [Juglans regia]KAF5481868.1 hypothetical protein F2P56_002484 [Juglans regia]